MDSDRILVLVKDLIFSSKITAEAAAQKTTVTVIRDSEALLEQPGKLLIVDLSLPGAIAAAGAWRTATSKLVVGFVGHTDATAIAAAKKAGIDQVLPRSRFVQILPQLLADPALFTP
jgi:hypothetical protein